MHLSQSRLRGEGESLGPRHPALLRRAQRPGAARRADRRWIRRADRRRAPRGRALARQGTRLLVPRSPRPVGPAQPAPRALGPVQRPPRPGRKHAGLPALQLDRARHLALHRRGAHPGGAALLRREREVVVRGGQLIPVGQDTRFDAGEEPQRLMCPLPHARLLSLHRRRALERDDGRGDHRRTRGDAALGAHHARHRFRQRRIDGAEEARRLLLGRMPGG